jgi:thiol-disulfide isomerase/thioredoxin
MGAILLITKIFLSFVFLFAFIGKLIDREASRQGLIDFGVPARLATYAAGLLQIAELSVAVALIPLTTAWWGALGSLSLLTLFTAVIIANLAFGRTPNCHCFGQLHSKPVGPSTLVRNVALAAAAGFVVWRGWDNPGPSLFGWMEYFTISQQVALWGSIAGLVLVSGQGFLMLQILRQQGRILLQIETIRSSLPRPQTAPVKPVAGLPVNTPAPGFRLDGLNGETVTLDKLCGFGKPIILIFVHPSCGPCRALMPEIAKWQLEHAAILSIVAISEGGDENNRANNGPYGLKDLLLQNEREVSEAYVVHGTPAAVVVRHNGTIGSQLALGPDAIRTLVRGIVDTSLKVGEPAPDFELADVGGQILKLSHFKGSNLMLLFWNPRCGFCERMLGDLKAWEASKSTNAPELLVITTGTAEENRTLGIRSPVVLDQDSKYARQFGANGTPMAVMIDAEGRIASQLAAGAQDVFKLAMS